MFIYESAHGTTRLRGTQVENFEKIERVFYFFKIKIMFLAHASDAELDRDAGYPQNNTGFYGYALSRRVCLTRAIVF